MTRLIFSSGINAINVRTRFLSQVVRSKKTSRGIDNLFIHYVCNSIVVFQNEISYSYLPLLYQIYLFKGPLTLGIFTVSGAFMALANLYHHICTRNRKFC